MKTAKLLLIDPQNDFCDIPGAALPVPGSDADMHRLANFMQKARGTLTNVVMTLDTHSSVGIERTTFWQTADGGPVAPFTQIEEAAVRAGKYLPRNPDPFLLERVFTYLHELELRGRYILMVWPVHCVLGTWGHNVHTQINDQLAAWEYLNHRGALKVLKGMNPLSEQYSAVRAEVPRDDDPLTQTNELLVTNAMPGDELLIVAGEAASHCVRATMEDLYELMPQTQHKRVILLTDCMSTVPGFERRRDEFFENSQSRGVQLLTADEALALIV
jgi:nicotinamidase-related amidase